MQVKFRGKIINEPNGILNGQWQYGSLIQEPNGICKIRAYHKNASGSHDYSEFQVEPESIGMFTGLHDMSGNEIYGAIGNKGGDIVVAKEVVERGDGYFDDAIGKVYYDEDHSAFLCGYEDVNGEVSEYLAFVWETECVGNCTDNPELLEQ